MTDEQNERAARVWREACAAFEDAADPELPKFENVNAGDQAATAVIAREIEADRAKIETLEAENARLREAGAFLLGRLDELEWHDGQLDETARQYFGHVDPAVYRFRAALGASHEHG